MKTRSFALFIVILALLISAGSVQPASAAARSQTSNTYVLRGKIDRQNITMNLTRTGNQIAGTYRYNRIGKDIQVTGTIDAEGKIALTEFGLGGTRPTGFFKGTWQNGDEEPGISLYGDWSKTQSTTNTLNFYASEDVLDSSLKIEPVQILQTLRRPKLTVDASYPRIVGGTSPNAEKFNQLMKTEITKMIAEFKKEVAGPSPGGVNNGNSFDAGYTVMFANDDLISVSFGISRYYEGAAHPMPAIQVYNYNLKTGKLWALGELFKPATYWLDYISRLAIDDLLARIKPEGDGGLCSDPDWVRRGAGPDPENFQNWNISRKGLILSFPPYQVACYAGGPSYVTIPFSKLQNLIEPTGPLAGF